jgi:predicted nucleotidyltransferase component of viral defense system
MATHPRTTTAGRVFNDLRNAARRQARGTDELLVMYVLERWLYRASVSRYQDQFILKGGLLLAALDARRSTRDGDLLVQMANEEALVAACVREIAAHDEDDGVSFNIDATQISAIREEDQYAGVRITMPATVGQAQVKLALDINFGDPVTPGAVRISYPGQLEDRAFEMWAYPIETVLAEKIVTAIARGETNTRERDWADIWRLTGSHDLHSAILTDALRRTAAHREVRLQPLSQRLGGLVELRTRSYRIWRQRQGNDAAAYPADLNTVVADVAAFADPLLVEAPGQLRWDSASRRWLR